MFKMGWGIFSNCAKLSSALVPRIKNDRSLKCSAPTQDKKLLLPYASYSCTRDLSNNLSIHRDPHRRFRFAIASKIPPHIHAAFHSVRCPAEIARKGGLPHWSMTSSTYISRDTNVDRWCDCSVPSQGSRWILFKT